MLYLKIKKINFLQEDLDLKWTEKANLPENTGQLKSYLWLSFMRSLLCKSCCTPLPKPSWDAAWLSFPRLVRRPEVFPEGCALLGVFSIPNPRVRSSMSSGSVACTVLLGARGLFHHVPKETSRLPRQGLWRPLPWSPAQCLAHCRGSVNKGVCWLIIAELGFSRCCHRSGPPWDSLEQ